MEVSGTTRPPLSRSTTGTIAGSPCRTSPERGDSICNRAVVEGRPNTGPAWMMNGNAVPTPRHPRAHHAEPEPGCPADCVPSMAQEPERAGGSADPGEEEAHRHECSRSQDTEVSQHGCGAEVHAEPAASADGARQRSWALSQLPGD